MRPNWDEYYMSICELASKRSTCDRKNVGAVLVKNNRIIATGYNGSLSGLPHCDDPPLFYQCPKCGWKSEDVSVGEYVDEYINCKKCYERLYVKDVRRGEHDLEHSHCCRTLHAELNALAQAARLGIATEGATAYINTYPCWSCFKALVAAGITEIIYRDRYASSGLDRVEEAATLLEDVLIRQFPPKE